jgi:hypothetical protein
MNNHEKTPASTRTPRYTRPSARANQGPASRPIRGFLMASLTLSLAAALSACWSATPQPITTVTQAIDEGLQVTNVEAFNTGVNSQAATGTTASSTGITINFDRPVNRASVEQSVNIFDGEINPATNPTSHTKFGLTSMCNGTWRVRNAHKTPIAFTWDVRKSSERKENEDHDDDEHHSKGFERGAGMVPANSDVTLLTSSGATSLRVLVNGKHQQTKHATPAACTSSQMTFAWAADSKSVVASPKTALVLNKTYSVVVSTFAKNSSGSAALSVPYVSKVVVKENTSTSGTLVPGGRVQFANGVVIQAPAGDPIQPVNVYAKTLPKNSIPIVNSYGLEPVSIFEIGSERPISSKDNTFSIALPIPQEYVGKPVYTFVLLPASYQTDSDLEGNQWFLYEGDISEDGSKVNFYTDVLFDGMTVGIFIEKSNLSKSNLQTEIQTKALVRECRLLNISLQEPNLIPCNTNLISQAKTLIDLEKQELINQIDISLEKMLYTNDILLIRYGKDGCQEGGAFYTQAATKGKIDGQIRICVNTSGDYVEKPDRKLKIVMRHELFHAVQFGLIKASGVNIRDRNTYTDESTEKAPNFTLDRRWITEGTARISENSTRMNLLAADYERTKRVTRILNDDGERYKTQDFWFFSGKARVSNLGYTKRIPELNYIKALFESGLRSKGGIQDVNTVLYGDTAGYEQGLKSAYWKWTKDQGYERNIFSKPGKILCQLDFSTESATLDDNNVLLKLTSASVATPDSITASPLQTRVVRFQFPNAGTSNSVKVTLEATTPTATPLNYKIYEGTVPSTQTDCTNDPEGTFQNGTKAEVLETVTNKTELVIFVANTDFVNPSSFTVTVEAQDNPTAPHINFNPSPIQKTLEFGGSNTVSVDLGNTGNADLSYTYEYVPEDTTPSTVSPGTWLGVGVSDGGLTTASVRHVGSKAIVVPGHKSILNFNLACPADPGLVSGASLKVAKVLKVGQRSVAASSSAGPGPTWPQYTTTIKVSSNDPTVPSTLIPVQITCRNPFRVSDTRPRIQFEGATGSIPGSFEVFNLTDAPVGYSLGKTHVDKGWYPIDSIKLDSATTGVIPAWGSETIRFTGTCVEGGESYVDVLITTTTGISSPSFIFPAENLVGDALSEPDLICNAPRNAGIMPRQLKVNLNGGGTALWHVLGISNQGSKIMHYQLENKSGIFDIDPNEMSGFVPTYDNKTIYIKPRVINSSSCVEQTGSLTVTTDDPVHPSFTIPVQGVCSARPLPVWDWGNHYLQLSNPDTNMNSISMRGYSCNQNSSVRVESFYPGSTFIFTDKVYAGVYDYTNNQFISGFFKLYDFSVGGSEASWRDPNTYNWLNTYNEVARIRSEAEEFWQQYLNSCNK